MLTKGSPDVFVQEHTIEIIISVVITFDDKLTLIQVKAWYCQATSYYLSQCWPDLCHYMSSIGHNDLSGSVHGPLARYVQLRVAHVLRMSGTFSTPPRINDPDRYYGTCVTHVPWCMPGSLTSGFLWSRWRGKCSRHSGRMRNPQFYISGTRPMTKWYLMSDLVQS